MRQLKGRNGKGQAVVQRLSLPSRINLMLLPLILPEKTTVGMPRLLMDPSYHPEVVMKQILHQPHLNTLTPLIELDTQIAGEVHQIQIVLLLLHLLPIQSSHHPEHRFVETSRLNHASQTRFHQKKSDSEKTTKTSVSPITLQRLQSPTCNLPPASA